MGTVTFHHMPTVEEMVNASSNISIHTAEQILEFCARYTPPGEKRLQLINFLYAQVDKYGLEKWSDLRWKMLIERVNELSSEVNNIMDDFSDRFVRR